MLTYLTTLLEVLQARIVYIGLCLARKRAILPELVRHTKRSTLLSSAIAVAVVHNMSVTDAFFPSAIDYVRMSW